MASSGLDFVSGVVSKHVERREKDVLWYLSCFDLLCRIQENASLDGLT